MIIAQSRIEPYKDAWQLFIYLLTFFSHLFYMPTRASLKPSPPLLFCPTSHLPTNLLSHFLSERGTPPMGINKECHIRLRQDQALSPFIKVGACKPARETNSQKVAQVPGTHPDPTARSPTNIPSYTAVMHMQSI